ncbi:MAG: lysophospholipid acyltransferase family protein [Egibacteraceae bacterium]
MEQSPGPDTSWARRPLAGLGRRVLLMGVLKPVIAAYTRPRVFHAERLKSVTPPMVLAANHASHLDTPVIMQSLPKPHRYRTGVVAAADYFFRSRPKAWFVSLAFATLPIERKEISATTRKRIDRMIDEGWNVLLFPEGTRTTDGTMGRLRSGAAYMATQYHLPLVPVYLTGTHEAMPKGSDWPRRHPVTIRFGEPLYPPSDGDHRYLQDQLLNAFDKLAAEAGEPAP